MTCVHKVNWTVKRPEDCRFRLSVSHYKDRIVAPEEYSGVTVVTPSDTEQVLPTTDKLVRDDIIVNPAPVEQLTVTENGRYVPSDGKVGFNEVIVDIPTTGYDKGTLVYEGDFSADTGTWSVTELPNGQPFAFDKLVVEFTNMRGGYNSGWRQYWRSDLPMIGNVPHLLNTGVGFLRDATDLKSRTEFTIDDTYITAVSVGYDGDNPTNITANTARKVHDGYGKITAYGWWSWICVTGTHLKITGYNRTAV